MKIETFEEIGLTNAEAKVYLTLLEIGPSKTGRLIQETDLQSSTIYHSLNSLIKKGIVSFILENKIKIYQAESPKILLELYEEKKKKIVKMISELNNRQTKQRLKQTAKIYKGVKGLQSTYNDILNTMKKGEEYYFFQMNLQELTNEELITFLRNYHLKRAKKGIKVKGLAMIDTKKKTEEIWKGIKNIKIKYVKEFLPTGTIIYNNKIILLEWEKSPISMVIESSSLANSYKNFFLDKWKKTK